jgi:hypothetical protein
MNKNGKKHPYKYLLDIHRLLVNFIFFDAFFLMNIYLDDSYSEDFDGSDKHKPAGRDGDSTDSSVPPSDNRKKKSKSRDSTPKVRF